MKQEEREAFFSRNDTGIIGALTGRSVHQDNAATQVAPGDFEATTGYTRCRPKGMTAQYLNECVDKRNGMEVTDKDGDVWGWVYDCHKNIGKWVQGDTHDERVKLMAAGMGWKELKPTYEPYYYTTPPGTPVFPAVDGGGFTVENHLYPVPAKEGEYTYHAHVPVNDHVKPYIIAVEGIDGAGKNTYTQKLAALLNARVVSFPQYGLTESAKRIEESLRGESKFYEPWHMAQMFAADRKESSGLLTGAAVIIVDRYVASNAAYLHAKTGYHGSFDAMETLEYGTLGLPKPDLQIFVDTPVEVAMGRVESRAETEGGEPDIHEVNEWLQERVREAYLQMVESQWVSPWIVIDGQAQK